MWSKVSEYIIHRCIFPPISAGSRFMEKAKLETGEYKRGHIVKADADDTIKM